MSDMTSTSLAAAVAPRTGKIIKNGLIFLKEGKICYKMGYYTLCLDSVNRQKFALES